jgi:hypothetical protein
MVNNAFTGFPSPSGSRTALMQPPRPDRPRPRWHRSAPLADRHWQ